MHLSSPSADFTKSVPFWSYENTTPFRCGVLFLFGRPDVSAGLWENGVSHSRGGRLMVGGLHRLRAPTPPVELPSSASADFERSENICYKKPQTFGFAAFLRLRTNRRDVGIWRKPYSRSGERKAEGSQWVRATPASADLTKSVQLYWLCKTPTPFGVGVFFCGASRTPPPTDPIQPRSTP